MIVWYSVVFVLYILLAWPRREMARKPLVLPDTFDGEQGWDEWIIHFENIAAVNTWDADAKLQWIKVRLTGRAKKLSKD